MTDIFDSKNELKNVSVNWNVPGMDFITGTLLSREEKQVKSLKDGSMVKKMVYELKAKEGSWHNLDERKKLVETPQTVSAGDTVIIWGRPGIDAQLKKIKIGQIIGIKFTEEIPNTDKAKYPTKIIKVFSSGEMDPEVMEGVGKEVDGDNTVFGEFPKE